FFFSSRRRHTIFSRDWSSDVCSSDLLTNLANFENVSDPIFHSPFSLTYTSVTIKGFVTVLPPTTASRSISLSNIAVLPIIFRVTEYTSAFLYHIPPLLITSSSRCLPHDPPICTNIDFS